MACAGTKLALAKVALAELFMAELALAGLASVGLGLDCVSYLFLVQLSIIWVFSTVIIFRQA